MKKLKVYFDFLCPFCYKTMLDFIEMIPLIPDVIIEWEPCESHPRPEKAPYYSDIAAEACLYVKGHKGDVPAFVKAVYEAHFKDNMSLDDKNGLAKIAGNCGIETAKIRASLLRRDYKQDVMANNSDIWDVYFANAVPCFYLRNKTLESKIGQEISREELKEYLLSL